MECYLDNKDKSNCFGCEACKQICPKGAITMLTDEEGFRYPKINNKKCINCNLCRRVCPYERSTLLKCNKEHCAFGGRHKEKGVTKESTSGGAFTAIVDAFCDNNYVIFGAANKGLDVYHTYITDKNKLEIFRKSKYSQSSINNSFIEAERFLNEGKKVLFSGTPCQIAGLNSFLKDVKKENLLTVEVICEGLPSPLYIKKYQEFLRVKYGENIKRIDYRYKDLHEGKILKYGKWDFEVMNIVLKNNKVIKKDRWFNPFWNIWLQHLMSRPSCYNCQFTTNNRVADITLGDLWGVHLYCPELYAHNIGASLVISNSKKGAYYLQLAKKYMYGHDLTYEDALKYQTPLKKSIDKNINREAFMKDLKNDYINYKDICNKWYTKPSIKLLWSKYVWGNRQKIFIWNIKNKLKNSLK